MKGENKERWLAFYGVCCCWNLKISLCTILKHNTFHGILRVSSAVQKHLQFFCSPPSEGKENKNQNNLFGFIIPFFQLQNESIKSCQHNCFICRIYFCSKFQPQRIIFRLYFSLKMKKGLYTIALQSLIDISVVKIFKIHVSVSGALVEILLDGVTVKYY